jgi:hypothetical protein
VPYGVHPAVKEMELAAPDAPVDGLRTEGELEQLRSRDDAVLPPRERGDFPVCVDLTSHSDV